MKIGLIIMAGAMALSGCSTLNGSSVPDAGSSERPLEDKIYMCCDGGGGNSSANTSSNCSNAIEWNGVFSCASDKVLFGCDVEDGSIIGCDPKSDAELEKTSPPSSATPDVHVFCCSEGGDPNKSTQGCEKPKQSGTSGAYTVWSCGKKVTWECDDKGCTE